MIKVHLTHNTLLRKILSFLQSITDIGIILYSKLTYSKKNQINSL